MPQTPISLYLAHDPMCSFCWAFRPIWEAVKPRLAENITVVSVVGGLAPDSDEPMPMEMQQKLAGTWKYIEQSIPATTFNHAFWTDCQPRRSTYPSCRAALIARNNAEELEDKITLEIQKAYYLNAQNPSDADTLINAAVNIGLDKEEFTKALTSEDIDTQLRQELMKARRLGLNSFPGILVTNGDTGSHVAIEYNDADLMLNQINSAIDQIS